MNTKKKAQGEKGPVGPCGRLICRQIPRCGPNGENAEKCRFYLQVKSNKK